MAHRNREIYFLTSVEYALLLAGMGVKQIYTLQSGQVEMDERKICLAMNHLYQTGLIDSRDEAFVIRKELKELLEKIKKAEYTVFVRSGGRKEQAICCFSITEGSDEISCDHKSSGKSFAAVQLSETDADSYKIYDMNEAELTEKIENEFLQNGIQKLWKYEPVPEEESKYQKIQNGIQKLRKYEPVLEEDFMYQKIRDSQKSISKEDIRKYHNLCLIAEQMEMKSGKVQKKVLVRLTPKGRCLEALDKGKTVMECEDCEEADIMKAISWVNIRETYYGDNYRRTGEAE